MSMYCCMYIPSYHIDASFLSRKQARSARHAYTHTTNHPNTLTHTHTKPQSHPAPTEEPLSLDQAAAPLVASAIQPQQQSSPPPKTQPVPIPVPHHVLPSPEISVLRARREFSAATLAVLPLRDTKQPGEALVHSQSQGLCGVRLLSIGDGDAPELWGSEDLLEALPLARFARLLPARPDGRWRWRDRMVKLPRLQLAVSLCIHQGVRLVEKSTAVCCLCLCAACPRFSSVAFLFHFFLFSLRCFFFFLHFTCSDWLV